MRQISMTRVVCLTVQCNVQLLNLLGSFIFNRLLIGKLKLLHYHSIGHKHVTCCTLVFHFNTMYVRHTLCETNLYKTVSAADVKNVSLFGNASYL